MTELSSVDVAISPVDKFREFLATKGKRLTQERSIIVEEVFSQHEHFEAEHLIKRLTSRNDSRRVSRPTIYRALADLVDAGLLRKVARTNDRDVFEHDYGYPEHDHLICKKCGTLIEFQNDTIARQLEEIAGEHGFLIEGHRLEVHGLCTSCSRPPRRRPRKLDLL